MKSFYTLIVFLLSCCIFSSCQDKSQETISQSDDIDTQKALANVLLSEANLPEGVGIKPLPEGQDLPYGINANPEYKAVVEK
jgi:hypothetical protein